MENHLFHFAPYRSCLCVMKASCGRGRKSFKKRLPAHRAASQMPHFPAFVVGYFSSSCLSHFLDHTATNIEAKIGTRQPAIRTLSLPSAETSISSGPGSWLTRAVGLFTHIVHHVIHDNTSSNSNGNRSSKSRPLKLGEQCL